MLCNTIYRPSKPGVANITAHLGYVTLYGDSFTPRRLDFVGHFMELVALHVQHDHLISKAGVNNKWIHTRL